MAKDKRDDKGVADDPSGDQDKGNVAAVSSAASSPTEPEPVPEATTHTIHVLKKFRFQYPLRSVGTTLRPGGERWFEKGDHVLDLNDPRDAEFLAHPWIRDHLADGRIEHPRKTMERVESEAVEATRKAEAAKASVERAEAALRQYGVTTQKNEDQVNAFLKEMNTPVNQRPALT